MTWLASLMFGLVVWLIVDPAPRMAHTPQPAASLKLSIPLWVQGVVAAIGLSVVLIPRQLAWVVLASAILLTARWLRARQVLQRLRQNCATQVLNACAALSAQLRVGQIPAQALPVVAADCDLLAPVAIAQQVGGDVPTALRLASKTPGAEGLSALARAWQLCEASGAPLAAAVARVAAGLRANATTRRAVGTELASARATGRLLAGLPAMGILFGFAAGGNPIEFLTSNVIGQACLAGAAVLACVGLVWTEKLADDVQQHVEGHR